jgi:hypothetical protein
MPKLTSTEKQIQLDRAYECLEGAKALRVARANFLRSAFKNHGDHGAVISGSERAHFPEEVKHMLRVNAHAIGNAMDAALAAWKASGKRLPTFRRVIETYRVDGSRY